MRANTGVRVFIIVALAIVAGGHAHLEAQAAGTIATVGLTTGWATFGEAVPQGQATSGLQIGSLATQTDVKNRWPDGSIKFAIVSANVPTAGNYAVTAAAAATGSFTPIVPTASVTLNIAGTSYVATLPGTAGSDVWLSGPQVREWRTVVAPVAGAAPHPFLRVIFDTRVYIDGKAHLSVTVENVLNQTGATTTTYDVTVTGNGQTLFTHAAVQHYYLTRWRKAYDLHAPAAIVTPDVTPFNVAKAIPAINAVVALDTRVDTIGANFDILQSGAVDQIMGAHGGRAELGPLPDWTARYLVKKNVTQGQFVMANGDLAGSWPIHVREPDNAVLSGVGTEHLLSIDQEPDTTLYSGGSGIKGSPMPIQEYGSGVPGPGQSPLGPSNAHVPDLAFVPYLLTGDRYYAEEMAFWANHGMLATSGHGTQGLLEGNEVRGFGWVLRNMAEAAAYYPDASPVKAYLSQKVVNNLAWLDAYANNLKTAANPLWIVYAWTPYDRPEGPEYFTHWENNYLAYGIDRAVKLGFATDNAYRDAANDLQLKFFTSDPDYPRFEGAPYAIPYGTLNANGSVTFFTTMAQFKPGAVANHRDFAGYYGPEARIAIMEARERGGAGAQAAYDYLWPFIGTGVSYCSTNGTTNEPFLACRAGFALDPYPAASGAPPAPCTYSLSASSASKASAAGTGSVNVTASSSTCAWTAASNASWISITSGASGTGTGSVAFSITANTSATSRSGTLTIAGQTFTVTQAGACTYTVTPLAQAVGVGGGTTTLSVSTGASCTWTASSALTWAPIASPTGTATGSGTVTLQVQANAGTAARSGGITVAGQSASLNQPGTSSIGSSTIDFNGDGVADTLSYNASTGAWSMTVTNSGTVASGSWPAGLAVQPADLDGNGLTDMFGYNATTGAWMKAVDNGTNGFTTSTGTWWPGWQVSLLDLDGRGQYSVFLDNGVGLMTPLTTGIAGESQSRPWLSSDRLRMYFSSTRASGGSRQDVFVAMRATTTVAFGAPAAIAELNLPTSNSAAPSLTSDELTIVFESDRAGGMGGADIWMGTRASRTGAFSSLQPLSAINSSSRDGSPELSVDGLSLYFESDRAGGLGSTDIWFATRDSAAAGFAGAVNFTAVNSSGVDGHPAISGDTQTLYFASDRAGGAATGNTWRARVKCDAAAAAQTSFPAAGTATTVTVTDASGCSWVPQSTGSWITFGSAAGRGSGSVTMTIAANSGAARTGSVNIGGQTIAIAQDAPVVSTPTPSTPSTPTAPSTPTTDPGPTGGGTPSPQTTPVETAPVVDTTAPRNLRTIVTGSTVMLLWDAPLTGEPVRYWIAAGSRPGASDLAELLTGDNGRTFTAYGVGSGVYMVRVHSVFAASASTASNEIAVVVGGGCSGPPIAPSGLTNAVDGSTVTLTWNASPGAVSSYVLVAGYSPGGSDAAVADTGNGYTTFVATGVGRNTYYVRLHARNACGVSGPSNETAVVVR